MICKVGEINRRTHISCVVQSYNTNSDFASPAKAHLSGNKRIYICGLGASVGYERVERVFNTPRLKSQIRILSFSEGCLWLLKQTQNLFLRNLRKFSKNYDFSEQPMHKTLLFFPKNNFSCFQRLLHINNPLIRRTAEFKTNILFFHNKRTIYKIINLF